MTFIRTVGALTAAAALVVPASAAAHGSVFETEARLGAGPETQVQYLVTNHGFTFALKESNGAANQGMINYKVLPKAYRDTLATKAELLAAGDTGAQPHATCRGLAALDEAAVLAWQGTDPFYNYVPWQQGAAGLEDDPAAWIAVVKAKTGVDLATDDPAASCAAKGGTYTPADETVSTAKALAAGTVEEETAPLTAEIAGLRAALATADGVKAALQTALDAAKAEIAKLATPMKVALPSAKLKRSTLTKQGTNVTLTGVAGSRVTVQLAIGETQARNLKLKSSVLATAKATLGADGSATVVLKPGKAAGKALAKRKRPLALTVTARAGDRIATAGGTLAAAPGGAAVARAAHTELKSSSPSAGSTRGTGLRTVTATFTQAIQRGTLRVTGPGGAVVSKGSGGRDPRKISRVRVGLKGSLKAGRYTARWTIKAVDGHEQSGSFSFKLRKR